jgi:ribosomal protein S18 acetylase RimI-like enzyme
MLIERLASLKMFDRILTWVDVENPRAVACYRSVGFTVIENRAHRFREGKLEMEQYGMEYKLL